MSSNHQHVDEVVDWVTVNNYQFYTHLYKPAVQPPKATLTIVHGLGEHVDRYADLARHFACAGIQVLGFDQRGFGKTGKRNNDLGDNSGIATVATDIAAMNRLVSVDGIRHFLLGHSMGGLNVLNFCSFHNNDGHVAAVIAQSPALQPAKALMLAPEAIETFRSGDFDRSVIRKTNIKTEYLTDNQKELARLATDADMIDFCTVGTMADVSNFGRRVIEHAPKFEVPVFIAHGDGDLAADAQGSKAFFAHLPEALDKRIKIYEDCPFHEIQFQEDIAPELFELYTQWILAHADCSGAVR
ncbi:alpha/beta-hydrolase [Linderina pennispora]|uniref:Alpha/beta-hydrolase n=1 Tax=Linderina pennispora TaxID=61395 RepID=A0A1Y1WA61_9FUNG|nr:alpha/beta-hydrolase [Linderina pennispora]ORX70208.1 alpha/beta-hydrolase [Linderina pennispora]